MVAITTAPVPPARNATAGPARHGCPARRSRRIPARYSPAATRTATSTGRSRAQDVTTRAGVSAGGPSYTRPGYPCAAGARPALVPPDVRTALALGRRLAVVRGYL